MRAKLPLGAAVVLAALGSGAAPAASTGPTAYRAHVNAICRGYTPTFRQLKAQTIDAQKRNDGAAQARAIDQFLILLVAENGRIERTPVPASIKGQIAPILSLLKSFDSHIRRAAAQGAAGDVKGGQAEIQSALSLAAPLAKLYDGAGLRDCGSNQ